MKFLSFGLIILLILLLIFLSIGVPGWVCFIALITYCIVGIVYCFISMG